MPNPPRRSSRPSLLPVAIGGVALLALVAFGGGGQASPAPVPQTPPEPPRRDPRPTQAPSSAKVPYPIVDFAEPSFAAPPAKKSPLLTLEIDVFQNSAFLQKLSFQKDSIVLGGGASADIVIPGLADEEAALFVKQAPSTDLQAVQLHDLTDLGNIFVNGAPMSDAMVFLRPGDLLSFSGSDLALGVWF